MCVWVVRARRRARRYAANMRALPPAPSRPPTAHRPTHTRAHTHQHTCTCAYICVHTSSREPASLHKSARNSRIRSDAYVLQCARIPRCILYLLPSLEQLKTKSQPIRTGRCASAGTRAHLCHCARTNPPERPVITCRLCPFLTARPPIPPIRVAVPTAGCTRTHEGTHPRARARITKRGVRHAGMRGDAKRGTLARFVVLSVSSVSPEPSTPAHSPTASYK